MKLLLLVLLVLSCVAAGYFYFNPDGLRDTLEGTPLGRDASSTRLYKWRDERGQWQISDNPPPVGIDYETVEYRHDVNIMPLPEELKRSD